MEDAQLANVIYSHPEDRNAHNSVFGGYLMRQALELSWACCYQFTKSRFFRLQNINDITFSSPVPGIYRIAFNEMSNNKSIYICLLQCHRY